MNYWTKTRLEEALPNAKFYNLPQDFSSEGVCVVPTLSSPSKIHVLRKPDEKSGLAEVIFNNYEYKNDICAIMCTDYEYFKKYDLPIIEVEDIHQTLYDLAKHIRKDYTGKVIAITGSAGKSTTTQICYDLLKDYGADGNTNRANTVYGLSWNFTNYDLNQNYWVNEVSLNKGMYPSARLVIPDVAVITNIAPVHLRPDESIELIAKVKARIFSEMSEGSVAIICKDTEQFETLYQRAQKRNLKILTFGQDPSSDIKVLTEDFSGFEINGKTYEFSKQPIPVHILLDMAAALAIVHSLGLNIDNSTINKLQMFKPISGRGVIFKGIIDEGKNITVMDESYNANPLSMKLTLEGFDLLYKNNPNKLLILGDMAEGGQDTLELHKNLESTIAQVNPTRVILIGECMSALFEVIKDKYKCEKFNNIDELLTHITDYIVNDDYIFIKGSHSVGLEKIVKLLRNRIKECKQ